MTRRLAEGDTVPRSKVSECILICLLCDGWFVDYWCMWII